MLLLPRSIEIKFNLFSVLRVKLGFLALILLDFTFFKKFLSQLPIFHVFSHFVNLSFY